MCIIYFVTLYNTFSLYYTANPNPKRNYTPRTAPQHSESESVWPNP